MALVAGVFGRVAGHELVDIDDYVFVAGLEDPFQPHLSKPSLREGLTFDNVVDAFSTYYFWTPLPTLSIELNHSLSGDAPAGFLLGNVVIHAASTLVLFAFLVGATGRVVPSGFVAAIFAVHPLDVEPVAWATCRKDDLAALFWMLALFAYWRWSRRRTAGRYALVALALAAALLSKSSVVTLPAVLLLLDYWPLRRLDTGPGGYPTLRSGASAVVGKLPLLALCAAFAALTVLSYGAAGNIHSVEQTPLGLRLAGAIDGYRWYLAKAFWPSDLAVYQPHRGGSFAMSQAPPTAQVASGAALLLLVTGFAVASARSRPHLLVGWLWFLVALLPMIGIVQVYTGATASRYMYLPGIGLVLAVVFEIAARVAGRPRAARTAAAVGCVVVVIMAVAAWRQVGTWRDSETLFRHAAEVTQDNWLAYNGLARLAVREARVDDAKRMYAEVFRIRPDWALPRFELASALYGADDVAGSLEHFEAGLQLEPNQARAHGLYGLALLDARRAQEALVHLAFALQAFPRAEELHAGLARGYARLGQPDRALAHHARAGAESQHIAELAYWLAVHPDAQARRPAEALDLARGIAGDASSARALRSLAAALAATAAFEEAAATARRALDAADTDSELTAVRAELDAYRARQVPPAPSW